MAWLYGLRDRRLEASIVRRLEASIVVNKKPRVSHSLQVEGGVSIYEKTK